MKRFIKIVNNVALTTNGVAEVEDVQEEIIPIENLVKVYRYIVNRSDRVIAYVYDCPVTGMRNTFYEKVPLAYFERKMNSIALALGWEGRP